MSITLLVFFVVNCMNGLICEMTYFSPPISEKEIEQCLEGSEIVNCLDIKWRSYSQAEKKWMMEFLADKANPEIDSFFQNEFSKTKDVVIRGLLFYRISQRHRISNLSFFIELLNDNRPMGHEHQPVYDFAISYLRSKILLKISYDEVSFDSSVFERQRIKKIYQDWLNTNEKNGDIEYFVKYDIYALKMTTDSQILEYYHWRDQQ